MNKTIDFFYEISAIPHPSGHEEKLAEYILSFAEKRGLKAKKDRVGNVIIYKKGNKGSQPVMLQAHMDMVAISKKNKDFLFEGIDVVKEGNFLRAKDSTLGADNGIGLSMILSVLDENSCNFPDIEALFTVKEETTMEGALNLEEDNFLAEKVINLDGTDSHTVVTACASMCVLHLKGESKRENFKGQTYKFSISGLKGGHSGDAIGQPLLNAIKCGADFLNCLEDFSICECLGGTKSNCIPSDFVCEFATSDSEIKIKFDKFISQDFGTETPSVNLCLIESYNNKIFYDQETSFNFIKLLKLLPHGVYIKEKDSIVTSSNLAIASFGSEPCITVSVRSSNVDSESELLTKIKEIASLCGFNFEIVSRSPFFNSKDDSPLLNTLNKAHLKLFGYYPDCQKIHACMEGGAIKKTLKKADICVISPSLYDIHTENERVDLESVEDAYAWLIETLALLGS